jgi:two-component system chemotaxis response regulator CheY
MTKRILAIDDSVSMRKIVAFTLRSSGYEVVEAVDGQDGLEKAQAEIDEIDLVLTDQSMPRMDGLALVKALRALARFKTAPILLLTTESNEQMKAQGRAAGANGWIIKPFDPDKLISTVRQFIG